MKPAFLNALNTEIILQHTYLEGETVDTIYFGGGTPSLLLHDELISIFRQLNRFFLINRIAEITLEVNPDDLNPEYLTCLREIGINRLSIGIQSFNDQDLSKMNRRHNAAQAVQSVENAHKAGFCDISIDLIFGLPGLTKPQWRKNLDTAVKLPVNHLSAYHLTYHEGTPFYQWLRKGKIVEISELESVDQFQTLLDVTATAGFEQYEISNFARNQAYSKHNSNYWSGNKYLGLGPSAHSYNGTSRQWNISDLEKYLERINTGKPSFEIEMLSEKDKINDYLITRLRTKWGISLEYLENVYGKDVREKVWQISQNYITSGHLERKGDFLILTPGGIMISDQIALALFMD
jgi:oxygen-independent coproporphyrinogen III oxidase